MQVVPSTFTVAEYCQQMANGTIRVNSDYQRSSKVWPSTARSYLMDTVLNGYPMPKLALYQKTDLRSRTTIKEIVDGQQRSHAIFDFYNSKFKIAGDSNAFSGLKFDQLDEVAQQRFLDYQLTVDIYVGATDPDIRQVFRRMNSYTVPLNNQEKRHATFQGDFKWFIADAAQQYSQMLKEIGVFREAQLSRMADAELLTEIVYALIHGIESASEKRLDNLYQVYDERFDAKSFGATLDAAFGAIMGWRDIHNGPLMKSYNFYSLMLAVCHTLVAPISELQILYDAHPKLFGDANTQIVHLTTLADALENNDSVSPNLKDFVTACSAATNRLWPRQTRFQYLCRALLESSL